MDRPESELAPVTLNVTIDDASNLPIQHVNALVLRAGIDEFFFTLGVVVPPDQSEILTATEVGHLVAQPVFRFAISRDTMAKFLAVMAGQYDQQTALLKQLSYLNKKADEEEKGRDE